MPVKFSFCNSAKTTASLTAFASYPSECDEILDHRLVVYEVGVGAFALAGHAEAEQFVLAAARDYRFDDRLNDLLAHRLLRIYHAASASGGGVRR